MKKNPVEKYELTPEELQEKIKYHQDKKSELRVFYGFSKLTKKAVRKRELAIYFENARNFKNDAWINRRLHLVHVRNQSLIEMTDSDKYNQMFTKYSYFLDDRRWKGNIDIVLMDNLFADENYISISERVELFQKLLQHYKYLKY